MPKQNSPPVGDKKPDQEQNEKLKVPCTPVACSTPGKYSGIILVYGIPSFSSCALYFVLCFANTVNGIYSADTQAAKL
jgi:hypothetical protein